MVMERRAIDGIETRSMRRVRWKRIMRLVTIGGAPITQVVDFLDPHRIL
jgi:hypothetical protein